MKESEPGDRMFFEYLPLVRSIARQIYFRLPKHVVFEDLVQAGNLGLLDAWRKYDCHRAVKFASYAKIRIRGSILDSLRDLDLGSRALRRFARQAEHARDALRTRMEREPSEMEVAEAMQIPLKRFQLCRRDLDSLTTLSYQAEPNWEEHSSRLMDCAVAPAEQSPYQIRMRREIFEMLGQFISQLPDQQRHVLALYYKQDLTMKEIGRVLGVGESRVSQIHSLAVSGLRKRLTELGDARFCSDRASSAKLLQ
jgi:RNA polymerase sigma factor for flagellar operon FliA